MKRKILILLMATAVLVLASASTSFADAGKFRVFAAASLNRAFPKVAAAFKSSYKQYAGVKFVFNFQGTDTLVAQIQSGAKADIFAGASTKYGKVLYDAGLIASPTNFCRNKLIVILPASNPGKISSLAGLAKPGKKIAIGHSTVPVGTYTRTVLTNLNALYGESYSAKVLANVVTEETNVTAVVTDVLLGEADAGFVYVTDAKYCGAKVKRLDIADAYQSNPLPTYPIARVKGTPHGPLARRFVSFVMSTKGQRILRNWGFLAPLPQ